MNSKAKGKRGEREAAKFLGTLGFTARRAQQYSGTESSADVLVEELPNVHVEVKYRSDIDIHSKALKDAMEQAINDCGDHKTPVVLWRKSGRGIPKTNWALTFSDWSWLATVTEPEGIKWWLWYLNENEAENGGGDE